MIVPLWSSLFQRQVIKHINFYTGQISWSQLQMLGYTSIKQAEPLWTLWVCGCGLNLMIISVSSKALFYGQNTVDNHIPMRLITRTMVPVQRFGLKESTCIYGTTYDRLYENSTIVLASVGVAQARPNYETERFTLPPTHLIKLYLSRDEDGWDCHHLQKQTQRLTGGNYGG